LVKDAVVEGGEGRGGLVLASIQARRELVALMLRLSAIFDGSA
jgi:hypothetical protein